MRKSVHATCLGPVPNIGSLSIHYLPTLTALPACFPVGHCQPTLFKSLLTCVCIAALPLPTTPTLCGSFHSLPAVASNIGVSQAMERAVIANSATARTTTGSALAFNEANSAVSKQNSATASADATTTTGQAAAISAAQGVGGVHSDSQGAASATTSTGTRTF